MHHSFQQEPSLPLHQNVPTRNQPTPYLLEVWLLLSFYCYRQFCKEQAALCMHTHISLGQILHLLGRRVLQIVNFVGNYQTNPPSSLTEIDSYTEFSVPLPIIDAMIFEIVLLI